ncbi:hypothetical protein HMN09_00981000 [Mycena chlorophos]|uniref:F-box domain-containing protein n=1 Tax=Mycena chlorophos TaxID=658473 RepID=A0A8H6SHW4_MYCCL|nr:hypothetical protein HMN09_00981000 [Mycena chlorophos]
MSAFDAPMQLTHVCRDWRVLVLDTSAMWARIHIAVPVPSSWPSLPSLDLFKLKTQQRTEATRTWLDRSGRHPLAISFYHECDEHPARRDPSLRSDSELLQLIMRYSSRWQTIRLMFPFYDPFAPEGSELHIFNTVAQLTPSSLPNLVSFTIDTNSWSTNHVIPWDSLQLLRAQSLKHLAVPIYTPGTQLIDVSAQWAGLTSLEVTYALQTADIPPSEILVVLEKCSGLRTLKLVNSVPWDGPGGHTNVPLTAPDAVLCPELRDLQLVSTSAILSFIYCPQLRHLDLVDRSPGCHGRLPAEDAQALRNGPTVEQLRSVFSTAPLLQTLRFHVGIPEVHGKLETLMEALPPTLSTLEIIDSGVEKQVTDELITNLGASQRCPRLAELVLRRCQLVSSKAIAAFLRSRCGPGDHSNPESSFRRLHSQYTTMPEDLDVYTEQVRGFMDAGIEVVIKASFKNGRFFSLFRGLELARGEHDLIFPQSYIDDDEQNWR